VANCKQEMCPNWSGDGRVCPCAMFDLDPPSAEETAWWDEEGRRTVDAEHDEAVHHG
jgi:hypothetical protein